MATCIRPLRGTRKGGARVRVKERESRQYARPGGAVGWAEAENRMRARARMQQHAVRARTEVLPAAQLQLIQRLELSKSRRQLRVPKVGEYQHIELVIRADERPQVVAVVEHGARLVRLHDLALGAVTEPVVVFVESPAADGWHAHRAQPPLALGREGGAEHARAAVDDTVHLRRSGEAPRAHAHRVPRGGGAGRMRAHQGEVSRGRWKA